MLSFIRQKSNIRRVDNHLHLNKDAPDNMCSEQGIDGLVDFPS